MKKVIISIILIISIFIVLAEPDEITFKIVLLKFIALCLLELILINN